ncbi:type VII secretion target [Streptomyces sp. CA2R101]|uniref:type VII secretion target n=1 Tax=Streptomyces sp. CA2R101 TaxID=3120152 RepID=UPI003009AE7D
MHGYGTDTEEMRQFADMLDEAARSLERADKGLDASAGAARTHRQWDSGKELKGVTSAWEGEYARLARECRNLAEKMRTTRMSYAASDQQTAADMAALLHRHREAH